MHINYDKRTTKNVLSGSAIISERQTIPQQYVSIAGKVEKLVFCKKSDPVGFIDFRVFLG